MPATLRSHEYENTEESQTDTAARNDRNSDLTAEIESITQPIPDSILAWVSRDGFVYSYDMEANRPKKKIGRWIMMSSKVTTDYMVISHRGWRWLGQLHWPPFGPNEEQSGSFVFFKRDLRISSEI